MALGQWINNGTDLSVSLASLENGTTYAFEVRAVGGSGISSSVSGTATPVALPGVPSNLFGSLSGGQIEWSWNAPASGGPVASYEYRSGITSVLTGDWTSVGASLSVELTELDSETRYYFEVRARNAAGVGTALAGNKFLQAVAGVPSNLRSTVGNRIITWEWDAPSGGGTVVRYEYRSGTSSTLTGGWTSVGTALVIDLASLINNTTYYFELRAVSGTGPSAAISGSAIPRAVPGAPTNLSSIAGSTILTWLWEAPATGGPVASYEYRYGTQSALSGGWTNVNALTGVVLIGLTNGVFYYFQVRAVNAGGTGPETASSAAPVAVPGAPRSLTSAPGDMTIDWSWLAPNTGGPVVSYEYRFGTTD